MALRFLKRLRVRRALRAATIFASYCRARGAEPMAVALLERLGDIVAVSAVVALLRERHPERAIAWIGRERYRDIALRVPGVEAFIEVDCYGELGSFLDGLDGMHVVDLNLNGKSCVCCGGRYKNRSHDSEIDTENYYDYGPLAQVYAKVAGIQWEEKPPVLRQDLESAHHGLGDLGDNFALLHSESEESARNWNDNGWRAVVHHLLDHTQFNIVHVGTQHAQWLDRDRRTLEYAGKLDLIGLLAVAQRCAFFIGIDSSVAHIANAFCRPGIVLLGRYRIFDRYLPYTGFYGPSEKGALVVRYPTECLTMPCKYVEHALKTALHRLNVGQKLGSDGPWDVPMSEIPGGEDAEGWNVPAVGDVLRPASNGLRASIDDLTRRSTFEIEHASGWAVVERTVTPPDFLCVGEERGDGSYAVRWIQRFSRLERPDVARALRAQTVLFSGWNLMVPNGNVIAGTRLALLFGSRATGKWYRMPLP